MRIVWRGANEARVDISLVFFLILLCGVPYFFCWQSLVNPSFSFIPDKLLPRCLPTSACFAQDAMDCPLWTLADSKLIELGWHGVWVLLSTRKVLLKLSGVKRTSQIAKSFFVIFLLVHVFFTKYKWQSCPSKDLGNKVEDQVASCFALVMIGS
jgi:hypothetical protein